VKVVKNVQPPAGLTRLLFRIPIHLYRLRLGWLFGSRLLLLNHIGRVSGKPRQTILEVAEHDGDGCVVASGWGPTAAWYRNIVHTPDVTIQVGTRTIPVTASNPSIDTPSTPGAPLFALTFSQASWTAHFEISNGLSGDFNSFTRLLPNPNGFRLIERIQPQMTRPLRSTPITGASPLLRAGPPAEPATVLTPMQRTGFSLSPARKPERAVSHPAFSRSMQKPQTGLASPPCRTPPGPSAGTRQARPGIRKTPRFRCHLFLFRHVNSESLALAFPIPT
jgi:deazaflavin-dependent oxidoreductase (nitroreductase family)